ncbi:alkaline phosphatase [Planctomonas psychrotolerans]|uniref:alkaline phosphatase n=1 Tax=Planctomonas psychrotolerans TaxID=2528712 RepID=UPI001D0D0993|nr:alkaline phosphatase [Planctomonas psychrotolerans]
MVIPVVFGGTAPAASAAPGTASTSASSLRYEPEVRPPAIRYSGKDRFDSAVAVSRQYPAGVPVAYIATGTHYADALTAGPAATAEGGPLLLTMPGALPATVAAELKRLAPERIVVVGGERSVTAAVFAELQTLAPAIVRVGGADRYATSAAVATLAFGAGGASRVYLATGVDFPDALSAGAAAGARGAAVLLVNGAAPKLDDATISVIRALRPDDAVLAGGPVSLSAGVETSLAGVNLPGGVTRLGGKTRFETSALLNGETFSAPTKVYLATGHNFPDALAGAALAGRDHAPLYVVRNDCVPQAILDQINASPSAQVILLGGTTVLTAGVGTLTSCEIPDGTPAGTPTLTPKNVIVLISDGGGYNQYDAARLYATGSSYAQVSVNPYTGRVARSTSVPSEVYDTYPTQLALAHYSASGRARYTPAEAWADFDWVKEGPTDSAAAATAFGTGVKTTNGTIGFDPAGNRLLTIGQQAKEAGKKVGLVTSVPFNHATPAGFIAHNATRSDYHGLATEMINSGADVLIGGGHPDYTDAGVRRASSYGAGSWISQADFARVSSGRTGFTYIESRAQFEAVAAGTNVPDRLFGLARVAQTFQYGRPGASDLTALPHAYPPIRDVPSLETAAEAALNVLDTGDEGFFLMVESGAVDWAGHNNRLPRIIEEQLAFNAAAEAVDAWVEENSSWEETLVIVTADHETGYLAGPGAGGATGWTAMTGRAGALPNVSWHSIGHTNALVPLFAKGAGSEVLTARATGHDPVRGAYLDNTDVGAAIFGFLGREVR